MDVGVVFMETNVSCKVFRTGNIKIKMFYGIVRMYAKVIHVSKLKKNLMSLVALDSRGYKVTCQGGSLKMSKGILVKQRLQKLGTFTI